MAVKTGYLHSIDFLCADKVGEHCIVTVTLEKLADALELVFDIDGVYPGDDGRTVILVKGIKAK